MKMRPQGAEGGPRRPEGERARSTGARWAAVRTRRGAEGKRRKGESGREGREREEREEEEGKAEAGGPTLTAEL